MSWTAEIISPICFLLLLTFFGEQGAVLEKEQEGVCREPEMPRAGPSLPRSQTSCL